MTTTVLRFLGDLAHTFALWILLHRLVIVKNAQGVSRETQVLLLMVCGTRYLDLFTDYYGVYNSFLKIFLTTSTLSILYILSPFSGHPAHHTYRSDQDDAGGISWIRAKYIAPTCFVLATLIMILGPPPIKHGGSFRPLLDFLYIFSVVLEPVAILPQILMFRRYRQVESLTGGAFIFLFGVYRAFYMINWVCRVATSRYFQTYFQYHHFLIYSCGLIHVAICMGGIFARNESETGDAPLLPQLVEFFKALPSLEFLYVTLGSFAVSAVLTMFVLFPEMIAAVLPVLVFASLWYLFKKYHSELGLNYEDNSDSEEENNEVITSHREDSDSNQPSQRYGRGKSTSKAALMFLRSGSTAPLAGVMSFLRSHASTSDIAEQHARDDDEDVNSMEHDLSPIDQQQPLLVAHDGRPNQNENGDNGVELSKV